MKGTTLDLSSKVAPIREWDNVFASLTHEFAAPIALIEINATATAWRALSSSAPFPSARDAIDWAISAEIFSSGQVSLWRPEGDGGPIWLGLPIAIGLETNALVLVGFASHRMADPAPFGPTCPDNALRAWGQSVADGRRGISARKAAKAPQGGDDYQLIARLVRKLRISDPPEWFQNLACSALRATLRVWSVAWVPTSAQEPVVIGGPDPLDSPTWRRLAAEAGDQAVYLGHAPESVAGSRVRRFATVAAEGRTPQGQVVVVDVDNDRRFTATEIAMLRAVASMIGTQRTNGRIYSDLKELLFGVIRALTAAIDAKDPYTKGHSERVARIAARLGEEMGMHSNQKGDLYLMGLLHDVGKIGVDDNVLKKAGPLTTEERQVIQSHVEIGVKILSEMKKLNHLLPGVAGHHESLDGKGYPAGLSGDAIPLEARILAVADSFDAMSSTRPYRRRLSPFQINDILHKGAGVQWDQSVINALFSCRADLEAIREKGLGESLQQVVNETLDR